MPPLNMNCVVPREQQSLASPGILGPPRAVLPTELHRVIQSFASSGPSTWRFAETTDGFIAELEWPTGTPSKPFLAVPPPLLTLIDDLELSRPFWSISITNDILSCSLSWANRAASSTPATTKTVPATPPHLPANDSGYSSPPSSSLLSPPRSRLTFAEAVLGAPAAAPSVPPKSPRSPPYTSTPKQPASHNSSPSTTTCSSTQTNAAINKPKPTSRKSSSSQTSYPQTNSTTTQTATIEPVTDKNIQTKQVKMQSSSCQSSLTTTCSTNTQTTILSASIPCQTNATTQSPPTSSQKSSSCQTLRPLMNSTTSQTTTFEPVADNNNQPKQVQLQSSSCQSTETTTSSINTQTTVLPSSTVSCQTTTVNPPSAKSTKPTTLQPSCKLCGTENLDHNLTYQHLRHCANHPTALQLLLQFVKRWSPTQINRDLPVTLYLLAAHNADDPTQYSSYSSQELAGTTTILLDTNTKTEYRNRCGELLTEFRTIMMTIGKDALNHLSIPEQSDMKSIYHYAEEPALNVDVDDDEEDQDIDDDEYDFYFDDDRLCS